jgi:hypothetical protein
MATLGVSLVRGHDFEEAGGPSLIIGESLARALFGRRNPVGQMLNLPGGAIPIIGVVRDITPGRFGAGENPPIWRSGLTHPNRTFMSVRFATPSLAYAPAVRAAIREVDPNLVVIARNLQNWIDLITSQLWNVVTLIVILGLVATVLATTGIYGAVSFAVNQRMRDLGIRVALGASRPAIIREVLVMGGRPVLRGLLLGVWVSVAMAALLRENLRESIIRVDSADPLVYISALALLALAAAAAMIGPAHRGSNSDPLQVLRTE